MGNDLLHTRPSCTTPRSTKPAACSTAPVHTHRRNTCPLRRWSTPHGAGPWPPGFPDRTSARPADFSVAKHFREAKRLALAIVPRRRDVSHTHTALNCLLCCCLLRAFLLVLLVHCILPASFCKLQCATQGLQTRSNAVWWRCKPCIATILRRKHPCIFLVTRLTSSLCPYHSFLSCARFQHYVSLILSWQGKRRV